MLSYPQPEGTVIFRPDSRNGFKDFYIDAVVAQRLMQDSIIHGDATNGGYMPSPKTPAPHVFKATYEVVAVKQQKKRGRPRKLFK